MLRLLCVCVVFGCLSISSPPIWGDETDHADLILVQGAGGENEYETAFGQWCQAWSQVATSRAMNLHAIDPSSTDPPHRQQLQQTIRDLSSEHQQPLWIVLIGHGTYFQDQAKFNLIGPDVSADELAEWLAPLKRPIAIVVCASCSGAFIDRLSAANRVIVTATRSGAEQNYARFGKYLAEAIQIEASDIDHDGAVSLLEAFLTASRKTQAFYGDEGRLATEHALLDDNGDRTGTSAEFFRGIRVVAEPNSDRAVDGLRAHQWMLSRLSDEPLLSPDKLAKRDELENAIEQLRSQKAKMTEDEYYAQLEIYVVQLATLYVTIE